MKVNGTNPVIIGGMAHTAFLTSCLGNRASRHWTAMSRFMGKDEEMKAEMVVMKGCNSVGEIVDDSELSRTVKI